MPSPGDIILIPFPYTNLAAQKTRPALVIYVDGRGDDLIILGITSRAGGTDRFKVTNKELKRGMLPVDSYIRYNKVATLHKTLVKKNVAQLKTIAFNQVLKKFKKLF